MFRRIEHHSSGNGASLTTEVCWFRWGGGANPGLHHVFVLGAAIAGPVFIPGIQCVVDDFGDLVAVEV